MSNFIENNPYGFKPLKILRVVKETEIDWTFTVAFDEPLKGGQFLELSIPGVGEAPISISDFRPGELDLTIRKVGRVTDVIFNLEPGQSMMYRGPYGNGFDLENYKNSHLKIIAGGTGLAPVKSVVRHFGENPEQTKSLEVLVGFKSPKDVLYAETLKNWSETMPFKVSVDQGDESWSGLTGLVTTHLKDLDFSDMANTQVIVVGPPLMMKFTTLALLALGVPKEQLWVSFERNMSCGIGKCGHCKIDETYVCLEGPVFLYDKAEKLID